MEHGTYLPIIKSLSNNTKPRLQFLFYKFYTVMFYIAMAAKKYMHIYCFHGKHFTCWGLPGMLKTDNFG